jgi:hypothetical protein
MRLVPTENPAVALLTGLGVSELPPLSFGGYAISLGTGKVVTLGIFIHRHAPFWAIRHDQIRRFDPK